MKPLASEILLVASVLAAVAFGFNVLRGLRLLYLANIPEETEYFIVPASGFRWRFLLALSPLLLYVGSIVLDRVWAWSRFGKAALFVHVVYVLTLVSEWAYTTWLLHFITRTA